MGDKRTASVHVECRFDEIRTFTGWVRLKNYKKNILSYCYYYLFKKKIIVIIIVDSMLLLLYPVPRKKIDVFFE